MSNVLCIGDCHCPAMIDGYPDFVYSLYEKYKCNKVVMIGDLVDCYAMSMHQKRIETIDIEEEFAKAQKQVKELTSRFPGRNVTWLLGNHDSLPQRHMEAAGVPLSLLKNPGKIWNTGRWVIKPRWEDHVIDSVIYRHGDKGKGGQFPALTNALSEFRSVVQGHFHQVGGVMVKSNSVSTLFGLQTGCGCDSSAPELQYANKFANKPVLGAAVVIDKGRHPIFEPYKEVK